METQTGVVLILLGIPTAIIFVFFDLVPIT